MADKDNYNFDHPDAMDWELTRSVLNKLARGEDAYIPNYSFLTCQREGDDILVKAKPLVIFEGLFALLDPEINALMDFGIFVEADTDTRLLRRISRDIVERGYTV